jgi:HlyD family secretion protein
MSIRSRGIRFVWLLGIVLLIGTAVGAGWFFNQPATGTGPSSSEPQVNGVVGLGYVDVESSVISMHPQIPGRIKAVWVVEGEAVREGDLLLSMENDVQRAKFRAAAAELDAAKKELADAAVNLPRERDDEIAIQNAKIKVAQFDYDSAKSELDAYEASATGAPSAKQKALYQKKLDAAAAVVELQQAVLKKIQNTDVTGPIERLKDKVKAKQAVVDAAQRAVFECDLYAPVDGQILRLHGTQGESLPVPAMQPVIQFCPNTQRIVRAEIPQEFADKVQKGQSATIEDDTITATKFKGKVTHVADWFTRRRSVLQEPFQYNDIRTLECIVTIEPGSPSVRIGQRVRVLIKLPGQ